MSKTGNPGFPHTSPVNVYGISYVIAYFSQVLTADVCAGPYSPLKGHSDTSGNLPEVSQLCLKKKKKVAFPLPPSICPISFLSAEPSPIRHHCLCCFPKRKCQKVLEARGAEVDTKFHVEIEKFLISAPICVILYHL